MHHVAIQNFQSHKETRIELSPTVNSLEGVSDSGKSAVLRAILWALTNKPDGTAFASYWAKDKKGKIKTPVSVSIDNITRVRSEEFNGYIRYGASGEERYEALKGTVPVEIERAINIGPVNMQRQMDPPFLLSATPGDAARYLNSLVGLEEIDSYQKALKGKGRDNANSLKDEGTRLAEAESKLSKYDWVDDAKKKVAELERICGDIESLESDMLALASLDDLSSCDPAHCRKRLDEAERLIASYPDTNSLYADMTVLATLSRIMDLTPRLAQACAAVSNADPKIDALARIDIITPNNELNMLSTALRDLEALDIRLMHGTGRIDAVNALIERGAQVATAVREIEMDMTAIIDAEYLSTAIQAKNHDLMEVSASLEGKACPICGKPL